MEAHRVERLDCLRGLVAVAVIGEKMKGRRGVSGRVFSTLGRAGVNVLLIAQGSSERNISFVISAAEQAAALRALHREFLEDGKP